MAIDGPNQLWVADITYVAIVEGFVYVAVILDAWSRSAVGYAISRSIDVRLTLAALNAAIERRSLRPAVSIIPIAVRNTLLKPIEKPCFAAVLSDRWAAAAIPTTTPRPRAS